MLGVEIHVQGVDELAEDLELLVHLRLGLDAGPIQDFGRGIYADARPNGERQGIRRSGIDGVAATVPLELEGGVERLLGKARDDHASYLDAEVGQGRDEQIVGQRPLGRHALQARGDGVGLLGPDPDRQIALALGFLEQDDMLTRQHVHSNALDDDFGERLSHGPIIPLRRGAGAKAQGFLLGDALAPGLEVADPEAPGDGSPQVDAPAPELPEELSDAHIRLPLSVQ